MKNIIAVVLVALVVLNFSIDATEPVRGAIVERQSVLDSI